MSIQVHWGNDMHLSNKAFASVLSAAWPDIFDVLDLWLVAAS
jgi:hypothetical protein